MIFSILLLATQLASGCAEFKVKLPSGNGLAIKAEKHGFSASSVKNATAINRAISEAKAVGSHRVVLAPGVYNCFDEEGLKLEGLKDFTLDGNGAKLIFRRAPEYRGQPQSERFPEKASILIRGCERVEVKNLTIDWDWDNDPLAALVRCEAKHLDERDNESYFDLRFIDLERHPGYPNPVPVQRLQAFDVENIRFVSGEQWYFGQSEGHFGTKNAWLEPNLLRVWPGVMAPGKNENPLMGNWASPASNRAGTEKIVIGEGYRLQHCYYGKNGIYMEANRHLTLSNVHILSTFGMGIVVDGEQEFWQLIDCSLAPPEGKRRPLASTADGMHVTRSKGHAKYINCRFSVNNDDSMNFHDRFTLAIPVAPRVLEIINRRGEEYVRMAIGSTLELRNPDFSATGFTAKLLKKGGELNQGNLLFVDRELPPLKGQCFLVWDRTYGTDNVIIRGCTFVDTASRNLFSPSNLTIEDCHFERTGRHPISIVADYRVSRWAEGFGATNIVIRGCTFKDDCTLSRGIPEISTGCTTPDGWEIGRIDRGFVGGNMLIEKCRFVNPGGAVLSLPIGKDVIFRDSIIEPGARDRRLRIEDFVSINGAENVQIDNIEVRRK